MHHRKFLFDRSFDHPDDGLGDIDALGAPRLSRKQIEAQEAALEAARAEGLAEGRLRGAAEAQQIAAERGEATFAIIASRLGQLLSESADAERARAGEAARMALSIARRMVPVLTRRAGFSEIEAVVADCLRRAIDEPRIVLRVAEEFFDSAKARIDSLAQGAGFAGRAIVLADPELASGDCRVEWADGGAERNVAHLWREIEGTVTRMLASLAEPAAPTA